MTKAEYEVRRKLRRGVNSFESNNADAPLVSPNATSLKAAKGNPSFEAQFDIQFLLKYFTVAAGVFTEVAAAALAATLKTRLTAMIFGNSDFAAGFKRTQQALPLQVWAYDVPFVYGKDYPITQFGALDATAKATLIAGDLVIPFWATTAGPVNTIALCIIRCTQVGYGTLLDAIGSDIFDINMLRYQVPTSGASDINQYANQIGVYKQSLFGKFDSDFVSPNSFKLPEQMQANIIDVPLEKRIDKQVILSLYVNYDCVTFSWSMFVNTVKKIS
jgi:hypothetical protein